MAHDLDIHRHPRMAGKGRDPGDIGGIVLHDVVCPDGRTAEQIANVLIDGVTQRGGKRIPPPIYHYLVDGEGRIVQLADEGVLAHHAGRVSSRANHYLIYPDTAGGARFEPQASSVDRRQTNGNYRTIGVAFVRSGKRPIPPPMWIAAAKLCHDICRRRKLSHESVRGHLELTKRKVDPNRCDLHAFRRATLNPGLEEELLGYQGDMEHETRPILRLGVESAHVSEAQERLRDCGLLGRPTGVFDTPTDAAVRVYQRCHWLTPDGIIGPRTWRALTSRP